MATGTETLEFLLEGGHILDREGEARQRVVGQPDHEELCA